jgi:acyl carrier protein
MPATFEPTVPAGTVCLNGRTGAQIEQWLIASFARLAAVSSDEIDVDRAFVDYQLDSSVAVTLANQLGNWGGAEIQATVFWEFPNIRELAAALASRN